MNQDEKIKQLERELQAKQYIIDCLGNEFVDLIEEATEADRELSEVINENQQLKADIDYLKKDIDSRHEYIRELKAKIDNLNKRLLLELTK